MVTPEPTLAFRIARRLAEAGVEGVPSRSPSCVAAAKISRRLARTRLQVNNGVVPLLSRRKPESRQRADPRLLRQRCTRAKGSPYKNDEIPKPGSRHVEPVMDREVPNQAPRRRPRARPAIASSATAPGAGTVTVKTWSPAMFARLMPARIPVQLPLPSPPRLPPRAGRLPRNWLLA